MEFSWIYIYIFVFIHCTISTGLSYSMCLGQAFQVCTSQTHPLAAWVSVSKSILVKIAAPSVSGDTWVPFGKSVCYIHAWIFAR